MNCITYPATVPESPRKADWRDDALCRQEEADDWFPSGNAPSARAAERHAQAVYFLCPSREPCGLWALEKREDFGVWGGMTEGERRAILRRRAARKSSTA